MSGKLLQTIHIQNVDHRRKIVAMMIEKNKMSTAAIAYRLGVPVRTVREDRLMMSVPNPEEVRRIAPETFPSINDGSGYVRHREGTKERRQKVLQMHAEKRTGVEMAKTLNVSKATIARDFQVLNLQPHNVVDKEARLAEIKQLLEAGMGNKEIARELGVSPMTVARDRERLGFNPLLLERKSEMEERRNKVKSLVESGKTYREISRMIDVPFMTVQRDCEALGILSPQSHALKASTVADRRASVKKMFKKKHSVKEIAEKLGVHHMTVRRDLEHLGLK